MEYCSSVKHSKQLTYATMWMILTDIMWRERSQIQRSTDCLIPFLWSTRSVKLDFGHTWRECWSLEGGIDWKGVLWGDRNVPVVTHLVKSHQAGHLRFVHFNVWKLNLKFWKLLKFIHGVAWISSLFLFIAWMYHNLFIHAPVDWHLGCFQFGAL